MYTGTKVRHANLDFLPDYLASQNGRGRSPRRKNKLNKNLTPVGIEVNDLEGCIYVTSTVYEY